MMNGLNNKMCDVYSYPEVSDEHAVKHEAEHGYFAREAWSTEDKLGLKYYNSNSSRRLNQMVLMNNEQVSCYYFMRVLTLDGMEDWKCLRPIRKDCIL
jgi:hypothetical protein